MVAWEQCCKKYCNQRGCVQDVSFPSLPFLLCYQVAQAPPSSLLPLLGGGMCHCNGLLLSLCSFHLRLPCPHSRPNQLATVVCIMGSPSSITMATLYHCSCQDSLYAYWCELFIHACNALLLYIYVCTVNCLVLFQFFTSPTLHIIQGVLTLVLPPPPTSKVWHRTHS